MRKIIKYFCAGLIIVAVSSTQVLADPLSDQLQSQQEQLNKSREALEQSQSKTQELEEKIQMFDDQIQNLMIKIDQNKSKIKDTQAGMDDIEKQVKNAEDEIKKEQELYCERIRVMYENGGSRGYLQIMLESKNIHDFFYRVDTIKRISKLDTEIKESLSNKKKTLEGQKQTLQSEKEKLVSLQANMQKDMDKLNSDKSSISALVAQAEAEQSQNASAVAAAEASVAAITKRIQDLRTAASRSGQTVAASRGKASYSDDSLIVYASGFIGTPYVWGGTSPNGFDCSGFVQYVYANFGISLPRTTYDQINVGDTVSRDELEPGDLIFFGSYSNPHHVGIYVGDGAYIHAPRTGDRVKISPLYSYLTAKRVR